MLNAQEIKEIINTYIKYGWVLKSILLTDKLKEKLDESEFNDLSSNATIKTSKTDGVLFSRPSKNNQIAWELRHLHSNPFALFELVSEDSSVKETEEILKSMENRLENHASNITGSKNN